MTGAPRPVLITGASGQVGHELVRAHWPEGFVPVALSRERFDLRDPDAISAIIKEGHHGTGFAAIINAAAYTAVDRAEAEQVDAWRINAVAPAALGQACATSGVPLIQISTDYVFSGDRSTAWMPDDQTDPVNVYGASKFGGELAIRTSGARHIIVRTAWVVSAHGQNFLKTMLRLGAERDRLAVVSDQRGSPTSAADLATVLVALTVRMNSDPATPSATVHFSNAGETDWARFAEEIFRQSGQRGGPTAQVDPIASADYPTLAKRPANSLLDHTAITNAYDIVPRPWEHALGDILDELLGEPTT